MKNQKMKKELKTRRSQKSDSRVEKLDFTLALNIFTNTLEHKFNYWYNQEILPVYLTKGPEHVTGALVTKTLDNFLTDIKASLNNKIFISLLDTYFTSPKAIDIFLKQYFYNKINARELKNNKMISSKGVLNGV